MNKKQLQLNSNKLANREFEVEFKEELSAGGLGISVRSAGTYFNKRFTYWQNKLNKKQNDR